MEKQKPNGRECLARHLYSLNTAGIEWIPNPPKVEFLSSGKKNPVPVSMEQECTLPIRIPQQSKDGRLKSLEVLREEVSGCVLCKPLAQSRTQTVFGRGNLDPEICFVGEAPGATEDQQGQPFVGDAGKLLDKIIQACGLKEDEYYICNILRCRPPGNRIPLPDEAANCRPFLEKQLKLVRPKVICCLGACAAQNLLDSKIPIGRMRGQVFHWEEIPVFCTFHPAYLLRSPEKKKDVWEDMKQIVAFLGRKLPIN